jgi:hypothetical protein
VSVLSTQIQYATGAFATPKDLQEKPVEHAFTTTTTITTGAGTATVLQCTEQLY